MRHFKRYLCAVLICVFLFMSCGCTPLSGSTEFLDEHPPEELLATYNDFYYEERTADSGTDEAALDVNGVIISKMGTRAGRVDVQLANRSHFPIKLYGYAWVTDETKVEDSFKAIYYNEDSNVSNASYTATYQSGHGGIAPFSFMDKVINITPNTVVFIFFSYRGTDYAAGVKSDSFVFWPLSQTKAD